MVRALVGLPPLLSEPPATLASLRLARRCAALPRERPGCAEFGGALEPRKRVDRASVKLPAHDQTHDSAALSARRRITHWLGLASMRIPSVPFFYRTAKFRFRPSDR